MQRIVLLTLGLLPLLAGCDEDSTPQPDPTFTNQELDDMGRASERGAPPAADPSTADPGAATMAQAEDLAAPREPSAAPARPPAGPSLPQAHATVGVRGRLSGEGGATQAVTLRAKLERDREGALLEWRLENRGSDAIYVFARLPETREGKLVPSETRVYSTLRERNLHVTRRLWRIPAGVDVYRPEVPFLIRLAPGQVYRGSLSLPRTLEPQRPYDMRPYRRQRARRAVNMIVFSLGYLVEGQGPQPRPLGGTPNLYTVRYGEAIDAQRIARAEPQVSWLSVLD